jgi:hypothetical protein
MGVFKVNRKAYHNNYDRIHRAKRLRDQTARYVQKRIVINQQKDKPCMDCKMKYPYYVMQFDHRDPKHKKFTIGSDSRTALQPLLDEIAKCDVVCANCHAERTHKQVLLKRTLPEALPK